MTVWKAALKSGDLEEEDTEAARSYCFQNGVVGIGWGVTGPVASAQQYRDRAAEEYEGKYWLSNHKSFLKAEEGDFVWSRSRRTGFWVGRFLNCNDWVYQDQEPLASLDLYQTRACDWRRVDTLGGVPGPVRNAFSGQGWAFSRIGKAPEITLYLSALAYLEAGGSGIERPTPPSVLIEGDAAEILAAIPHDELEDLVGLYLQNTQGWMIIPGTCKMDTANTEFEMINSCGDIAHLQVKSGAATISDIGDTPDGVSRFYVFQAGGAYHPDVVGSENTEIIDHSSLWGWMTKNSALIPVATRRLLAHRISE